MTGSPQTDPRLAAVVSERGFNHMPAVPSEYGGEVTAYESSAASAPHIWLRTTCPEDLNDPTGPSKDAVAHLTADSATVLSRQLAGLVANHYQLRDDEEAPDPRAEALRRELQFDKTTTQLILEAIDAADEASGVRRVTAQELADNLELARQEERQRLIEEFAKAACVAYKAVGETDTQRLLEVADRVRNGYPVGGSNTVETVVRLLRFVAGFIFVQPTADSPVGGVS